MDSSAILSYSTPAIYPQAVALAVLSFIVIILDIPALVWHSKSKNIAAISLIAWLILLNLFNVINVIIWPNDSTATQWKGYGLCDVEVKLQIGSWVALTGALAAIMRNLCQVMDTNTITLTPSAGQKRWDRLVTLSLCIGIPVVVMALHYIVQNTRYYLFTVSGCTPGVDDSWLAVVLVELWPLVLSLADAYYGILLTTRLHRYRTSFSRLLALSKTTKSRFLRLFLMSAILVLVFLPLQFYVFFRNVESGVTAYSWGTTHGADWGEVVILPTGGLVIFDRWIRPAAGALVFVFFGIGNDAVRMYKQWLVDLGLGRVFPGLLRSGGRAAAGDSGTSRTSLGLGSWASMHEKARKMLRKKRDPSASVGNSDVEASAVSDTFPRSSTSTFANTNTTDALSPKSYLSHEDAAKTGITVSKQFYQEMEAVGQQWAGYTSK